MAPPARSRARTVVASILGVLAVLLLVVTLIAVWARVTVFRSNVVASLVGDGLDEPEVQTGLANYVSEQVFTAVDVNTRLAEVLPDQLARFAPAIAGGAETFVERQLQRALSTEEVQDVITTLVERAHARALQVLQGDGLVDGINVSEGQVSLNLLPLVGRGLTALQSRGLFDELEIPTMTPDGDPEEQAAALSSALGRDLPDGFGQLVVYEGEAVARAEESVETAQRTLVVAKRALWLIAIVCVVLVAAAIAVAPRRWRAAFVLGLGTAAALIVLRVATRQAVGSATELAERPGGKAAIAAILGGASDTLLRVFGVVLLIALVTMVVALYALRWPRADLITVGAVLLGAALVAIAGVTIWSLLAGVAVAVIAAVVARRFLLTATPGPRPAGLAPTAEPA